jgi:16S rRNA (cytosine1402-N4)-methyltransferase
MSDHDPTHHIPVLLQEVLQILNPLPGQTVVDATLGGGGHSERLLDAVGPHGRVIGIDADSVAIERTRQKFADRPNFTALHGNFSNLAELLAEHDIKNINAILFDFGFSSDQLDNSERGFSFQNDGPLDMRLHQAEEIKSARDIVNNYTQEDLARIIKAYGEEINARGIARGIIIRRKNHPIETTAELFDTIKAALPGSVRYKAGDVARRTFQALRIETNKELDVIKTGLEQGFAALISGGRMAAISFHSLEDRIVKQYFASLKQGCICPPEFPLCRCGHEPQAQLLALKPIGAGIEELAENPRSASAKLRAIEKI